MMEPPSARKAFLGWSSAGKTQPHDSLTRYRHRAVHLRYLISYTNDHHPAMIAHLPIRIDIAEPRARFSFPHVTH